MKKIGQTISDIGELIEVYQCEYCGLRSVYSKTLQQDENKCKKLFLSDENAM